uniref:Uncharacterized protein n=1 Tax=viral metagenome TaxID=1070528 RepID=A0A6C0JYH1_9ZZZZ
MNSPFYDVYIQQKDIIDSAVEKAIEESAKKLGKDLVNELFSIRAYSCYTK